LLGKKSDEMKSSSNSRMMARMLRLAAIACVVVNVAAGLALAVTRGGILGQVGVPPPAPIYSDLLAVFLVAAGLGFLPAVNGAPHQRTYLWIFGVGVKLVAASLMANLWFSGLVGWLVAVLAAADAVLAAWVLVGLMGATSTGTPRL
jgi:hypothetical protein